jgi:predicted dehydrogenase
MVAAAKPPDEKSGRRFGDFNMNKITIGMIGAGRAAELHSASYALVPLPLRLKTIAARRASQLEPACKRFGFERFTIDIDDIINDPEIDVVDICTPPYVHADMIIQALRAGKHVICEKPLTGYFGLPGDEMPIGERVSKRKMYESVLSQLEILGEAVRTSGKKLMYAENFVYAPAVIKAGEIVHAKKSRILFMKGEESLKGSSSAVAGRWDKTGGGIFMRNGVHPIGAMLWLKQQEAAARGVEIKIKSIVGDMGYAVGTLNKYEHRHIAAHPVDVEDSGTAVITFDDGTKAAVIATDNLLGGSKNCVELYCNDAAINCRLTMNDAMETYLLDEDGMDDVHLSEMLPVKTGWNRPFIADEVLRGYVNEMNDFMHCVYFDTEPRSGFALAADTARVVYAAYYSAESGRRVDF